jgi:hypothetical protein
VVSPERQPAAAAAAATRRRVEVLRGVERLFV